jgi:hypothetical protein
MKRIIFYITFILAVVTTGYAQNSKTVADPVGTWKFEAPYAPEGYNSGIIVIVKSEQKHTVTMSFTGSEYKLNGENVIVEKDSVSFSLNLEGQVIKVSLKSTEETKMTGKALYSEGEVPLSLTKAAAPAM